MSLRSRRLALLLCLALAGCFPLVCGQSPVVGQFGPYPRQPAVLRTSSGDAIDVYRIKYWKFESAPPALQLEFEFPDIADTVAVRRAAHSVWPVFAAYVDSAGLTSAILTATALERRQAGALWAARSRSFGILAHRDSLGRWYLNGEDEPLLPAEPPSSSSGIFQPDGSRVSLALGRVEGEAMQAR